ncbi:MAG TPA: hypothetical protein P5044_12355, partial [bacterium]|nr:hypothetical protein [bacterium]
LVYVSDSFKDRKAVTITDYKGNTLTVYQEGAAVYMNMDRQILWSKSYPYFDFSLYPAFGTNDLAFLPCYMELKSQTCGIALILDDGSFFEPMIFSGYSAEQAPSISIDNDYRKFISDNGVLKVYDSDNTIMYDTSSVFPQADSSGTVPPVITDTGFVYFSNNYQILAFRKNDNVSWAFDLNKKPVFMVHNDGKLYVFDSSGLYVFYAPGKAEGKWPQMLHDAGMTGSYTYMPEFDRPSASELSLPDDEAVFDDDTVNFKWVSDIGDPEIKYTLLLRDSSGYDKVYAGPQKGLSTATVEGLSAGTYEWRVVSKDLNGALNVSEARTFTIQ